MPIYQPTVSRFSISLLTGACALTLLVGGCAGGDGNRQSELAKWMENPTSAEKLGDKLYWPALGVTFEKPDTLYVFKECSESSHSPDANGWIPIMVCSAVPQSGGEGGEYDEYAEPEAGAELISMTFSLTEKSRPLDERTVGWFENQYKEAGFEVDDLSFQHDYQNKSGIYAKLQMLDNSGSPTREVLQYMFPKRDVVFIARIEYAFGDARAIQNDWKYLLWNFDIDPDLSEDDGAADEEAAPEQGESDIEG
jgi:hypothetical protein